MQRILSVTHLKALGNRYVVKILGLVANGARTQREIADKLEIHRSRASRNLALLYKAGLIEEYSLHQLQMGRPAKQYRTTTLGHEILSLMSSRVSRAIEITDSCHRILAALR